MWPPSMGLESGFFCSRFVPYRLPATMRVDRQSRPGIGVRSYRKEVIVGWFPVYMVISHSSDPIAQNQLMSRVEIVTLVNKEVEILYDRGFAATEELGLPEPSQFSAQMPWVKRL